MDTGQGERRRARQRRARDSRAARASDTFLDSDPVWEGRMPRRRPFADLLPPAEVEAPGWTPPARAATVAEPAPPDERRRDAWPGPAIWIGAAALLAVAALAAAGALVVHRPKGPADAVVAYHHAFDASVRSGDPRTLQEAVVADAWPRFVATQAWIAANASKTWPDSGVTGVHEICSDAAGGVAVMAYDVARGGREPQQRIMAVAKESRVWKTLGDAQPEQGEPHDLPSDWAAGYRVECPPALSHGGSH